LLILSQHATTTIGDTTMSHAGRALLILTVGLLGLWGCSQGMNGNADRLKIMEARITRLEDELKTTIASRDAYKIKLVSANDTISRIEHDLSESQALLLASSKELNETRTNLQTVRKELSDVRAKLMVASAELTSTQSKLQSTQVELSSNQARLQNMTRERDAVVTQYTGFRKQVNELLGQAETAAKEPLDRQFTGKEAVPILPTSTPKPDATKPSGS
jgi:chromosome segregation ATPase